MAPSASDPKHLLVIGVGPGIGAAVATRFATEGFRLTLVARREAALQELAAQIRTTGAQVTPVAADAADPVGFRAALESIATTTAPPGVVVYNAALLQEDNLLSSDAEHLMTAYVVDVVGAIIAAQVFAPHMQEAGAGTILLTGGGLALHPHPSLATVSLGKAGIRSTGALLAADLAPRGVHVSSVTISASVQPGTDAAPEIVADLYWGLHQQAPELWTNEAQFPRN
jgi:short-subunit dehydrogenase